MHKEDRGIKNEKKPRPTNKAVTQDDLVELILGPLADQIDRARFEILSAVEKVSESAEIIARELKCQSEPGN